MEVPVFLNWIEFSKQPTTQGIVGKHNLHQCICSRIAIRKGLWSPVRRRHVSENSTVLYCRSSDRPLSDHNTSQLLISTDKNSVVVKQYHTEVIYQSTWQAYTKRRFGRRKGPKGLVCFIVKMLIQWALLNTVVSGLAQHTKWPEIIHAIRNGLCEQHFSVQSCLFFDF